MITVALVLISSFFIVPFASATDVCSDVPHSSADYYVETSKASWLMSQSCVDSSVVATMPTGSVMHVIGKTEGWHKLVTEDGHTGWMWEDFVTSTSKTFNPVGTEPEPTPEPTPEVITHDPMYDIYGHKYEDAIWHVYNNGIVQGYEDGSYKPDNKINRAELLKIIVEAKYDKSAFEGYADQSCFDDVPANTWFTPYVCFAKAEGIVEGYDDGAFRPDQEIIFVEALKIAWIGFDFEFDYEDNDIWYSNYVATAGNKKLIPIDVDSFDEKYTRGQMADMIMRMMKYDEDMGAYFDEVGDTSLIVTYHTINLDFDVESLVGTGQCVNHLKTKVVDEGAEHMPDAGTLCTCTESTWICEGVETI